MIVLVLLLIRVLMLPIVVVLVCVWVIYWLCTPQARRPAPVVSPGCVTGCYAQNVNSICPGPGFGWMPAPGTVWPAMWVSPAIPAELGESAALQVEPSLCGEFLQQRRQLSGPAGRVVAHGTRR